jgi:serine phosphatase RsbU (regulator of sigma subunit)
MSMVPNRFPHLPEIDLYALMSPAKEVGGDLYDFFLLGRTLYFCIGDVSGKGVPASLFMAVTRVLFRNIASQQVSPAEVAKRINMSLSQMNDNNMFVTMFIARADFDTGRLDFCNCGHNPSVIAEQGGKAGFMTCQYKNMPLGLFTDFEFKEETIENIRDKQLLLYTDGLNEATNLEFKEFGDERLLSLMGDAWSKTSNEVIDMLHDAVESFREGAEPNDDLTMMCLRLKS